MALRLKTDWILFTTILVMVCSGLIILYSASSIVAELKFHSSWRFVLRQIGWAAFSFVVLMFFKKLNYRKLQQPLFAFGPIGAVMGLVLFALVVDSKTHRWLSFSGLSLQPSELAKPALILFLAFFISQRIRAINDRHTLLPAACLVTALGVVVGVGDLGTAIVLVVPAATMFYVAGLRLRFVIVALVGILGFGIIFIAAKPYRLARTIAYFEMYADPSGAWLEMLDPAGRIRAYSQTSLTTRDAGYQAKQSRIAVGAGGVLGRGLMQGHQKLLFLPEAHTDFIYAVVGEELGLWGSLAIIAGFLVIAWRGLLIYFTAGDNFGKYIALGVTISIIAQALINITVVLDLGPTKGIPLPMISYGGTSLLSTLTSMGLLLSVSERAC